ncbi:class I SAM-dependent methyltransferase [Aerosakkonemataceae cyanobacterium BLCC-F50]|uniref:Class I SAM-dependent methyltransferase n=1 Tax=Floridaenema flaviceps BLCC-F50 TaxID=3153642 RepID=A0ABV4XQJ5_9CYAN
MQRVLEPEVMDSWEEAVAYDAMDFTQVNAAFAQRAIALAPTAAKVLDAGTGTARIPLLLCQQRPQWQVTGIDLAENMLKIGAEHIKNAGLQPQIVLELVDAKQLPYPNAYFDLVISNSLIHHLPDPLPFLQEIKRVLKPKGAILIRDLIRPANQETLDNLVESIGTEYDPHQKQLFADSLHAAFTLDEVNQLISQAGLQDVKIYQSSDRHWTVERSFEF